MKLEANELRIGNIINSKLLGTSHLIQGFIIRNKKEHLYTDLQESYSDLEDWQGVKATEEELLKIGFEKVFDGNYKRYQINLLETNIYLRPSLDKWYFGFVNKGQDCEISDCYELEFVHEIQNLIFSLTKKELTFKPGT